MAVAAKMGKALRIGLTALLACLGLWGCGQKKDGDPPVLSVNGSPAHSKLFQPFTEAALANAPDQILPDVLMTGKSVGKLYEQVGKIWNEVQFVMPDGRRLDFSATIDTGIGPVEIALFPDAAPNHVRNFIALARAGYYDGLVFERTHQEKSDQVPADKVELIEGGCPVGTGNPGYGSIGYWLKPELSDSLHHEEGTIGACRGEDPNTAACRFYITLCKAPVMDGEYTIFGKVTRGLDVVHKISSAPVINSPEFPLGDRPQKPVVIRKVTIHVKEVDKSLGKGENK